MTGDTLTISTLLWSAGLSILIQSIQDLRSRDLLWAGSYAFAAAVLVILGFTWPSVVTFLNHPPKSTLQTVFPLGTLVVALAYTYAATPKGTRAFSAPFMARLGEGFCLPPFLVLILAPYLGQAAIQLILEERLTFALAGMYGILSAVSSALERRV